MHSTPTIGIVVTIFFCWCSGNFVKSCTTLKWKIDFWHGKCCSCMHKNKKHLDLELVLVVTENFVDFWTKKDYRYWACHIIHPAGWKNIWIKHSLLSHSCSAFPRIIEMTYGNHVGMIGKVFALRTEKSLFDLSAAVSAFSLMLMVYINRLISMQYLTVTAVTFCVSFTFLITQGLLQLANSVCCYKYC